MVGHTKGEAGVNKGYSCSDAATADVRRLWMCEDSCAGRQRVTQANLRQSFALQEGFAIALAVELGSHKTVEIRRWRRRALARRVPDGRQGVTTESLVDAEDARKP